MKTNGWKTFGKGVVIGSTMIVPGVSGGTMAMILGIYDSLLEAIASFPKEPRKYFRFLLVFSIGGAFGLVMFSPLLAWLLENFKNPTLYFFVGAVCGGIPFIANKSGEKTSVIKTVAYLLLGFLIVFLISNFPMQFSNSALGEVEKGVIFLMFAGMLSAVALILPGISFSHFLLILGIYDGMLSGIRHGDLQFLVPLAMGTVAGILLFSRILEMLLKRYSQTAYLIILGFVAGSAVQIFPGIRLGGELPICILCGGVGFFCTYAGSALNELSDKSVDND